MIARRRHDEVEITTDFLAISLGNDRLKSSASLLECDTGLCRIASEFAQAKAKPE